MKKNIGTADRTFRVLAAIAIVLLLLTGQIEGAFALLLGVLAAIFVVTSLIGVCPLYLLFRISTRKKTSTQTV